MIIRTYDVQTFLITKSYFLIYSKPYFVFIKKIYYIK